MNASVSSLASLTSFSQLFGREINGHTIQEIEIPLIQRDYAQGRKTENVNRIRESFINTLCKALMPGSDPIDLDFIFGDVEESGKFYPLDGQQRLTTLFLLHCYLAWRVNTLRQDQSWTKFSYATRPGARDFCSFLVKCQPDFSETLSDWITDQADYLPTWQHDPTIQSMLVVFDDFHKRFATKQSDDLQAAWNRLMDKENPAIRFHVLPMRANNLTDELYIKMNSRGKPLTPFENFKAHFEDVLKKVHPAQADDFVQKVDRDWSNILWPYRDEDDEDCLIDDKFMRYFRFVTEICAWKSGIEEFNATTRDDDLADKVYSSHTQKAVDSLAFLFKAFNVWEGQVIKNEFENILTSRPNGSSTPLLMFNPFDKEGVDLFHACCRHYGTRQWTLSHTLLLYAVLLKPIYEIAEANFQKRLRILRNLVEASGDEIRAGERNNMPKLLADVVQVIVCGNLQQVTTFNQVQVKNEQAKAAMLQTSPALESALHRLEDHDLLQGGLTVFDLDSNQFTQRAQTFIAVFDKSVYSETEPWKLITGALLAKGNYSRQENRSTGYMLADFGAPKNDEPWRDLFRGKKGESIHPASKSLMALLDAIAAEHSLQDVINGYINDPTTPKDWRYYFVKYDTMREGASGRYTISPGGGYQICMLNKERMSSYYYDPYLLTMVNLSDITTDRIANPNWPHCFSGVETNPRKMILKNSGLEIQCVDKGWEINKTPTDPTQKAIFDQICNKYEINAIHSSCLYPIPQVNGVDILDRIEKSALLLKELVNGGL